MPGARAQPPLAATGRIAISDDGNFHDRDDICAAPVFLAILSASRHAGKLVYFGYNDHFWQTSASQQADMTSSATGTPTYWNGFKMAAFHSVVSNRNSAVNALTAEINASTAANPLTIQEGGPAQVIGLALAASNPRPRNFVTVVSHSAWNNTHAETAQAKEGMPGPSYTFADLGKLGAKLVGIHDQNTNLSRPYSEWFWARDSSAPKIRWLWSRGQVAAKSTFDCSDAGVTYFIVTGDPNGTPAKLRSLLSSGAP